jgi:protein-tyrosine phosphatase
MTAPLKIVTLCTGNVARSVMLGYMFTSLAEANGLDWSVRSAGTHVIEGSAMSARTRDALEALPDLGEHRYGHHRSHQLTGGDVAWADVVVTSEASQVKFVRTNFPDGSSKTVSLGQFLLEAPLDEPFHDQVHAVAELAPDDDLDVIDPAGGNQDVYDAIATQLWAMAMVFLTLVEDDGRT